MIPVDALGPDGERRTRAREIIRDTAGVAVGELSIVPRLFVARSISRQRKARPLAVEQREKALGKAADLFLDASLGGLDFDAYVELTCRVAGLPMTATREGARGVAEALATAFDAVRPARPIGAVVDWRGLDCRNGAAMWSRRGEVLGVHAPGNAPGVHGLWPQALALGYRIAVRPSRREPFTAHRVILALRQAGFRCEDALYLPTDYAGANELIQAADLALVYGGQDVVDRYANESAVFTNGPGRSKILITAEQDWRDHLDVIVESVCKYGGMACVNASAVLYEGDAAPLAHAVAERLATIPASANTDEHALLPTAPIESAQALADHLAHAAAGTTPVLGADQVVADLGNGYAALRPAVHLLAEHDPGERSDGKNYLRTLNVELPFPCVWVARWSRGDGIAPLRNSLVLSAITDDMDLVGELVNEPTVTNLYVGGYPTYFGAPHIPHDGFLADFLMWNKGFARC